ncbi:MAG: phosphatase PAP2 family protein [Ignavibacteriaceae bacterium]
MPKVLLLIIVLNSLVIFPQDSIKVSSVQNQKKIMDSGKFGNQINVSSRNDSLIISDAIKPDSKIERDSNSPKLTWHSWLTNIPSDYARFYDVAIHTSIPVYLSIAASTAALMATDNTTWLGQHEWYKNSNFIRQASDRFGEIGDGRTQFTLTGVFVLYGLLFKDNRALRTGSQILQVTISAGAFAQVLKHMTGRESPVVSTQPAGKWKFFPNPFDYHKRVPAYDAYPSGHLTTMLGMIGVISENYPEWKWVKPVGYSLCTLMALGMVNSGIHWYSDYPLAIYLGYEFGKIVAHPEKYGKSSEEDQKKMTINIAPYRAFNATGLALSLKF